MKKLTLALCLITFLNSCSSDTEKTKTVETKDTVLAKENFAKGELIEKVSVLSDASQSYALYLPSSYTPEKSYPIIYIFDAHADGRLPVSMYKELAEKYGYILVGSNNSRNGTGWEETKKIADNLFSDSHDRLSIDPSRIYLMGFSGGARVANALCISNGGIAGVICCGAAAPAISTPDPRSDYTFLGICGNGDFNYIEMRKYDMVDLIGRPVKHAFIEFDGKHEWPGASIMKEGFLWCELGAMRKHPKLKDDGFVKQEIALYSENIKLAQQNKKTVEVYNLVRRTINFFDGLADLKDYYAIYKPLKENAEVDAALKKEQTIWQKEEELKAYYGEAFQSKNSTWWKQETAMLNKKTGKTEEQLMNKRLLDYLSLVAYMQTSNAIQQKNMPASKMFAELYRIVDPTNSEADYLTAELFSMEGNKTEAFRSLEEALKNGFKDPARLETDPMFDAIRNSEQFKELTKKTKAAAEQKS